MRPCGETISALKICADKVDPGSGRGGTTILALNLHGRKHFGGFRGEIPISKGLGGVSLA